MPPAAFCRPVLHILSPHVSAQEQIAELEGGDRGFAFTSGMAALAAVCKLVSAGEHIVAGEDIYGGTSRLLANVVPAAGVSVTNVDMTDLECVGGWRDGGMGSWRSGGLVGGAPVGRATGAGGGKTAAGIEGAARIAVVLKAGTQRQQYPSTTN